jgi:hypothetical protein
MLAISQDLEYFKAVKYFVVFRCEIPAERIKDLSDLNLILRFYQFLKQSSNNLKEV